MRPEDAASQGDSGTPGVGDRAIVAIGRGIDALNQAQDSVARNVFSYLSPNPDLVNARSSRGARESYGTTNPEGIPRTDRSTLDRVLDVIDPRGSRATELLALADPAADELGARAAQVADILEGKSPRDYDTARDYARIGVEKAYEEDPEAELVGKAARVAAGIGAGIGASPLGLAALGGVTMGGTAALESPESFESDPASVATAGGVGAGVGALTGGLLGRLGGAARPSVGQALKSAAKFGAGAGGSAAMYDMTESGDPMQALQKGAKVGLGVMGASLGAAASPALAATASKAVVPAGAALFSEALGDRAKIEGPRLSDRDAADMSAQEFEGWDSEVEDFPGWDSEVAPSEPEVEDFPGWE